MPTSPRWTCWHLDTILYIIASVYSQCTNMVGLHLHDILSPFLSVMAIFFVDLKLCHSASTLSNHVFLGLTTGLLHLTLNSIHFLILITFPHHMSTQSQSTTSNDSNCDRLNSSQLSLFLTCPSTFHGNTTHPSNHPHDISIYSPKLLRVPCMVPQCIVCTLYLPNPPWSISLISVL